jgi:hypothetical protein
MALKTGMINFFYTVSQNQLTVHYRQIPCIVIMRQFERGRGEEEEKKEKK